jgi:uncharacterized membrane protein
MAISPKTTAATVAAAAVTLATWIAGMFGVEIPEVAQGAIITILVALAAYVVRDPNRSV